MPQKKNPDVPELVRGKSGARHRPPGGAARADEGAAARVQQGQPGRQGAAVRHRRHARRHARDHDRPRRHRHRASTRERMRAAAREGFATATDLADYLVRKGVPFRDAHEAVARAVRHAESEGRRPRRAAARRATAVFAAGRATTCTRVLTLEGSVASRDHPGGTAPAQVRAADRGRPPRARATQRSHANGGTCMTSVSHSSASA